MQVRCLLNQKQVAIKLDRFILFYMEYLLITQSAVSDDWMESPQRKRDVSRSRLLRAGVEMLCEQSYASMGVEHVLAKAGLSKGSFYHFFPSKQAFGLELIAQYAEYCNRKLDRYFSNQMQSFSGRLKNYADDAVSGIEKFEFRRGCLVGNLSQELAGTLEPFRSALNAAVVGWEDRVAALLSQAKAQHEISPDTNEAEAAQLFWSGWQGALTRARMQRSANPLVQFTHYFMRNLN